MTKVKTFAATLVVAGVVMALWFGYVNNSPVTDRHNREEVKVSVVFTPERLLPTGSPVSVDIVISTGQEYHYSLRAPWPGKVLVLSPGTTVNVVATSFLVTSLECAIHVGTKRITHDNAPTNGMVHCFYRVTTG